MRHRIGDPPIPKPAPPPPPPTIQEPTDVWLVTGSPVFGRTRWKYEPELQRVCPPGRVMVMDPITKDRFALPESAVAFGWDAP